MCSPGWPANVGLDAAVAAEVLGAGGDAVRADEPQATVLDIYAVPTFVIERRLAIPGAQVVGTFSELLTLHADAATVSGARRHNYCQGWRQAAARAVIERTLQRG